MKTTTILLGLGISLICSMATRATTLATNADHASPLVHSLRTPKYDELARKFAACEPPFVHVKQWLKVLKPALQDLGYSEDQIKAIKKTLSEETATLEHAAEFCSKWLARYGERINEQEIFQLLPHQNTPGVSLAVK